MDRGQLGGFQFKTGFRHYAYIRTNTNARLWIDISLIVIRLTHSAKPEQWNLSAMNWRGEFQTAPRIKSWIYVYFQVALCSTAGALYLALVFSGKALMDSRTPFQVSSQKERFVKPMSKTMQSCKKKHNFPSSCALRWPPGAPAWRLSPSSASRELCRSSYTFSSTAASRSPFAAPVISPLTRSQKNNKRVK